MQYTHQSSRIGVRTPRPLQRRRGWKSLALAGLVAAIHAGPAAAIERVFYIQAIEHKGKTNTSSEPFPSKPLEQEAGMKIKVPIPDGTWAVEAYAFSPSQITVVEGDLVILHFIGINGAQHNISIEGVKAFKVTRGTTTTIRFTPDKPGIIPITCFDHQPNMNGQIVVMRKDLRGSR